MSRLLFRNPPSLLTTRAKLGLSVAPRLYGKRDDFCFRYINSETGQRLQRGSMEGFVFPHRCLVTLASSQDIPPECNTIATFLPEDITPKLVKHVEHLVLNAVEKTLQKELAAGELTFMQLRQVSMLILRHAVMETPALLDNRRKIESNRDLYELGELLSKVVPIIPAEELLLFSDGNINSGRIKKWKNLFDQRVKKNAEIFHTISNHHKSVANHVWKENVENKDSLKAYAEAAASMGKKDWVKESNEWMADFIMSYYRFGGAKKHFCKKNGIFKHDPIDKRYNTLSKDLMALDPGNELYQGSMEAVPSKLIRILDVGSCYNPLQNSSYAPSFFNITAVDLFPADETVFQCDFLNLMIGPPGSAPIYKEDPITKQNSLLQLPANSFDVITMSLVLSYLSSPSQREAMIEKARKLLITPLPSNLKIENELGRNNQPHHTGLLLIVEKESIFSRNHQDLVKGNTMITDWKKSICQYGFELVKYNLLAMKDSNHHSHTFAFATTSDMTDGSANVKIDNMTVKPQMWIRQDYVRSNSTSNRSVSDDKTRDGFVYSPQEEFQHHINSGLMRYNDFYLPVGIIGGGIGGTALALSLQHHGIPFYLFEKDVDFASRRQGYALTMQQGGIALRDLDVAQEVIDEGAISVIHYSYDARGNVIGAYGAGKRGDMNEFDPSLVAKSPDEIRQRHNIHLPRQKLREILMKKVHSDSIFWNKKLLSFSGMTQSSICERARDQDALTLKFQDCSEYKVSLIVGADGVFSTVRQQIMSSLGEPSTTNRYQHLSYLNLIVILGISHRKSTVDGRHLCARQWLDGENRIFSMPYDKDKTMWQMSFPMKEEEAMLLSSWNKRSDDEIESIGAKLKLEALTRCKNWDPSLIELLLCTRESDISGHPVYDRDIDLGLLPRARTDAPSNNLNMPPRVTLLGDAVHPMSPFKGQGANQALLDALQLSRALLGSDLVQPNRRSIAEALYHFEQEMLMRSKPKVLKSRDAALYLHSPAALAVGNITRAKAAQLLYQSS